MSGPSAGGSAQPVTARVDPGPPQEPVHVRLAWAQHDAGVADEVAAKMAAKREKYLRRADEMVAAVEQSYADAVAGAEAAHARVAALAEEAGITHDHDNHHGNGGR